MIWGFLLCNLAAILLATRLSHCGACLRHAAPFQTPVAVWNWLPWLVAVAAATAFARAPWRGAGGRQRRRPLLELLALFPPLLALINWERPAGRVGWHDAPVLLALAVLAGRFLWRELARRSAVDAPSAADLLLPRGLRFRAACLLLASPTLLIFAGAFLVGRLAGTPFEFADVGLSLLVYPLYALGQILLFVTIPVPRLRALGASNRQVTVVTALLFALLHWPNPVVMVATGLAMLLWTGVYLRRPSVAAIALSMGIAATAFAQLLPDEWTENVTIGSTCTWQRAWSSLAVGPSAGDSGPGGPVPNHATADVWLARLYPAIVGRQIAPLERERWHDLLVAAARERIVLDFLLSDEFAARIGLAPPSRRGNRARWDPAWRERLATYGSVEYLNQQGGTFEGLLRGLYRDLLGRAPAPLELAAWSSDPPLSETRQRHLLEVLHARRRELAAAPFKGMSLDELRWP